LAPGFSRGIEDAETRWLGDARHILGWINIQRHNTVEHPDDVIWIREIFEGIGNALRIYPIAAGLDRGYRSDPEVLENAREP